MLFAEQTEEGGRGGEKKTKVKKEMGAKDRAWSFRTRHRQKAKSDAKEEGVRENGAKEGAKQKGGEWGRKKKKIKKKRRKVLLGTLNLKSEDVSRNSIQKKK